MVQYRQAMNSALMGISEHRKQSENHYIYKRKIRKWRSLSGVDSNHSAHKYHQNQWWALVNFGWKNRRQFLHIWKTANHSVRTLLHFILHTVVTKRQFVTPATLALSVSYCKHFDNIYTMSMLIFMLLDSRDFFVFDTYIVTNCDWIQYLWPTIKHNSPSQNTRRESWN